MILIFNIVSFVLIIALVGCALVSENKGRIGKSLQKLLSVGALGILFHVIFLMTNDSTVASVMFACYSGSVDFMLVYMLNTAAKYSEIKEKTTLVHVTLLTLSALDVINLLINQITGHAYSLTRISMDGNETIFTMGTSGAGYVLHLFYCYVLVIMIFGVYVHGMISSSTAYRIKYSGVMTGFSVMLIVDGAWVAFKTALNIGVILYGVLGLIMFYFALYYSPNSLLEFLRKKVMDRMDNGVICLDEKRKVIFSNEAFWRLVDCEPNDSRVEKNLDHYFNNSKHQNRETTRWSEEHIIDGAKRYFEIENQNFFDKKDKFMGCYFSIHDITEQQIDFERQIDDANKANKMKSDFLSKTSHEIRTPVNAISGMNEMILRESDDEKILEYAGYIKESTDLLVNLINDILDFSKIESGRMEIHNRTYEPDKIFADIAMIMGIRAEEKAIDFQVEVDDAIPAKLYGDDVRIRQIITNLLTNAIKYTETGFVKITISWVKNGLQIDVTDSGIGIKEENIPKLFDAYERVEDGKVHGIQGTGLGLNITGRLVQMMDGYIHVDSELGEGSSFVVFVPQMVKTHKTIGENKRNNIEVKPIVSKDYKPEFVNSSAKILIVDDNSLNRRVFCNLLKKTEAQITEAASGPSCLELVAAEKYDIIFLDHMMPDMDGIETFEKYNQMENNLNADTPVIMLTANAIEGAREQYLSMGFTDFLSKPIDSKQLEDMLCKYVSN